MDARPWRDSRFQAVENDHFDMSFWYDTARVAGPTAYQRRIVDDELDELQKDLAAIAIEGPKAVGKTRTGLERAKTVHRLDDPAQLAVAEADPARLLEGDRPVLIDEWQRLPTVWDLVRRAVDEGAPGGSFLLTGSAIRALPRHTPAPAASSASGYVHSL
jgi:predicted AAA+ superfamily ATPase